jgi:uncharacterized protein YdhG (YjbR/CyaY superfamily)
MPEPSTRRADFGAPIEDFLEKQPAFARAILDELRALISEVAPEAQASLKWGMPFFTLNGKMFCALTAHKAHVNLVLYGPKEAYSDPERRLAGTGKAGYHLRIESVESLPREQVRAWLETAAGLATVASPAAKKPLS